MVRGHVLVVNAIYNSHISTGRWCRYQYFFRARFQMYCGFISRREDTGTFHYEINPKRSPIKGAGVPRAEISDITKGHGNRAAIMRYRRR